MTERIRPSFRKPPVVEVVCGVYFQTLALLQAAHVGRFWEIVKTDFPRCASAEPVPPQFDGGSHLIAQIRLGNVPPLPRTWLINDADTALVQIQSDGFFYNWKRGQPPHDVYPRYPQVVDEFKGYLGRFRDFLREHRLGDVVPHTLEMLYINQVDASDAWKGTADLGKVFRDIGWHAGERYLPAPSAVQWRGRFELDGGHLEAALQSGHRLNDSEMRSGIRLDLTARGRCPDLTVDPEALWQWFNKANEWIVDGFIDLTDPDFQRTAWERTQ